VGAHYKTDIGEGRLTADITSQWASGFPVSPLSNQPFAENNTKKRGIVNASIGYTFPGDMTRVAVFGRNLANKWSMTAASNYFFYFVSQAEFTAGLREVDRGPINPPRQIGLTVTQKF
jgi:iron complex outermembrane receptor protein